MVVFFALPLVRLLGLRARTQNLELKSQTPRVTFLQIDDSFHNHIPLIRLILRMKPLCVIDYGHIYKGRCK
ncbi:hypothetical protein K1719_006256 [Acacia pycnantha]|nr:hypothetical protein K1719_006256 [Acacia pycnantha]